MNSEKFKTVEEYMAALEGYDTDPGTIRFPIGKPLPLDLVSEIVKFRVKENLDKAAAKAKRKI